MRKWRSLPGRMRKLWTRACGRSVIAIRSSPDRSHPPSTCHRSSTWQEAREAADLAATLAEAAEEEAEAARAEEAEGRERCREAEAAEGIRLQVAFERWTASEVGRECAARREALPIGAIGKDVLAALEKAQVCGMCGRERPSPRRDLGTISARSRRDLGAISARSRRCASCAERRARESRRR